MCLFYYCNFALGECKLYKGITNYIYNRYWGVQIPGSTYYMLHRVLYTSIYIGPGISAAATNLINPSVKLVVGHSPWTFPPPDNSPYGHFPAICCRPRTSPSVDVFGKLFWSIWECSRRRTDNCKGAVTKSLTVMLNDKVFVVFVR